MLSIDTTMTTTRNRRPCPLSASIHRLPFLLLIVCHPLFALAQKTDQKHVEVSDGIYLTLPALWGVTHQSADTAEIDYPVLSPSASIAEAEPVAAPSSHRSWFSRNSVRQPTKPCLAWLKSRRKRREKPRSKRSGDGRVFSKCTNLHCHNQGIQVLTARNPPTPILRWPFWPSTKALFISQCCWRREGI